MAGILVLSDTHVRRSADLPREILELARRADLVIHAGDFTHGDVLAELGELSEVVAVKGNMDVFSFSVDLPKQREVEIEGVRIGIIHGSGSPNQAVKRACAAFTDCDVIVFGHSHQPLLTEWGGVVMFNPGSPTDHRFALFPTYGWLKIEAGSFESAIHRLGGSVVDRLTGFGRNGHPD